MNKTSKESGVPNNNSGFGAIKVVAGFFIAVIVIAISVIAFYEGRKAYWDYRVKRMCEDDGGVVVLEHMTISKEQEKYLPRAGGVISVSPESLANSNAPAFSKTYKEVIRSGSPKVARIEHDIIRRSDEKRIAKAVIYLRTGGDIMSLDFPSVYYCPSLHKLNLDISGIFRLEEPRK